MVEFAIERLEGLTFVTARLAAESMRAEAGAFCYARGDIRIHAPILPSLRDFIRASLADEAVIRPTYSGTGLVTLESSLGGFEVLRLADDAWILEPGAYWASDPGIELTYHREPVLTALFAGEGLIYLQTKVHGTGQVVLHTKGPVEALDLPPGDRVIVEGKFVIARSANVHMSIQRATRNFWGRFTSGERAVRVFEVRGQGVGRVLLNPSPFWRYHVMSVEEDAGSKLARTS